MADTKRARFVQTNRKIKVYGGRGPIYAWLRTNHEEIAGLLVVHRNLWAELALDMVEDGIAEAANGRFLRNRVWQSWQRVKRDIAAEAAAVKPKKVPPSHISPDWRPTVVAPPPSNWPALPTAASPGALVPVRPPGALAPGMKEEVHPEIAKALAEFAVEDKRRFRFGGG